MEDLPALDAKELVKSCTCESVLEGEFQEIPGSVATDSSAGADARARAWSDATAELPEIRPKHVQGILPGHLSGSKDAPQRHSDRSRTEPGLHRSQTSMNEVDACASARSSGFSRRTERSSTHPANSPAWRTRWFQPNACSASNLSLGVSAQASSEQDKAKMRTDLLSSLKKVEYDVSVYYWSRATPGIRGRASSMAQNSLFERLTLLVISANALWIGYDQDFNGAQMLSDAAWQFQVAEHVFCAFFSFEWVVRFLAFKHKRNCLRDAWFVFDSILVSTMVAETWVLLLVILMLGGNRSGGNPLGNSALLRMGRLLRLSRMFRMGRLLRAIPELLIQLRGLMKSMRSVVTALVLLILVLYMFGVLVRQLGSMDDGGPSEFLEKHFPTVPMSMYSLLVHSFFMDNLVVMSTQLWKDNKAILFAFGLCLVITGMAVQNMLIGLLCEVVSSVGVQERANLKRAEVGEKMALAMQLMKCDGDIITKDNFMTIFQGTGDSMSEMDDDGSEEVSNLFADCGIDLADLLDIADFIFADEANDESEKSLVFEDFVDVVMQLRGDKEATVKDMVDMRKFLRNQIREAGAKRTKQLKGAFGALSQKHRRVRRKLDVLGAHLGLWPAPEPASPAKGISASRGLVDPPPPPLPLPQQVPSPGRSARSTPGAVSGAVKASQAPSAGAGGEGKESLGGYAGRLDRVEWALGFARQELRALSADIAAAPVVAGD